MTRLNKILAAAAIVTVGMLMNQARADNAVASPRVQETLAWQKTVPGITEDKLDRSIKPVSPRLQQTLNEKQTVQAANDPDLAHPSALTYGTLRQPFPKAVELAPLK